MTITESEQPVYHTYKDRVFRLLFKDKKRLLKLYNALNDTAYTEVDDLTVNTLENAIFMKMKNDKNGCLELAVRTLNINHGHNKELMDKCKPLSDYSYFIAEIRKNLKTMSMEQAVAAAVDTCIKKDILRDFLLEQKAEVIAMSIYEYNEEYVKKTLHEEGYDEGYDAGKSAGLAEGEIRGKAENIISNVESIIKNLGLDLPKACEGLGITIKEYEDAKNIYSKISV